MRNEIPVVYQDTFLVVVRKPAGILVHRHALSPQEVPLLQRVRDQIGRHVFPVHRLDRGTSGLMVFGLSGEVAAHLGAAWQSGRVKKEYLAIVRGWMPQEGCVDHPLEKDGDGELQEAKTTYRTLNTAEIPAPISRYATARYSLIAAEPLTGRMHQIRRHMAHLRHPIVGDHKHGDRHHNHYWEGEGLDGLMLHAHRLGFCHPASGAWMEWATDADGSMAGLMERLGWGLDWK